MHYYVRVLRLYADFSGRARRKEYWMFVLINLIVTFALDRIDTQTGLYHSYTGLGILGTIYTLAVIIPGLAVSVRRMHDVGYSGWTLLVVLIPIIGAVWVFIMLVTEGERKENQYGLPHRSPQPGR
jgi:uncharacterized membrane protein YhaH (DUF805 family)